MNHILFGFITRYSKWATYLSTNNSFPSKIIQITNNNKKKLKIRVIGEPIKKGNITTTNGTY